MLPPESWRGVLALSDKLDAQAVLQASQRGEQHAVGTELLWHRAWYHGTGARLCV